MASFNIGRVLEVLAKEAPGLNLDASLRIARKLVDMHSERVITVENNAYERGIVVGKASQNQIDEIVDLLDGKTPVENNCD